MAKPKPKTSVKSAAVPKKSKKEVIAVVEPVPKKLSVKSLVKRHKTKLAFAFIVLVALLVIGYLYNENRQSQRLLKSPDTASEEGTKRLIKQVGKHILLPTGEKPTVATVSDVSKLSKQSFFADAQNNDRVLVYTKARKVVLYRPSSDRIISFSSLNLDQKPAQSLDATTKPPEQ